MITENLNSYETKYPDCLCNVKDLQLGPISLRYLGCDSFPSLLTIYELEKPAILAYSEISNIIFELGKTSLSSYVIKGLFSLAIAHFETMLFDLMKKQLQFFPQKLASIKANNEQNQKEIFLSPKMITAGYVFEVLIEKEIQKIAYSDIQSQLSVFCNIMSIKLRGVTDKIDNLIEVKETRNLLLHNNLYVNDFI